MAVALAGNSRKNTLGRYELERELASDFMGRIWSARIRSGPNSGSFVTIRRLAETDSFCRNAIEEITSAALWAHGLDARMFVTVTDVVRDQGELGIVFAPLEGSTLRGVIRTAATTARPVVEGVVARIALDVAEQCAGLARTDGAVRGYLHGGLAPESVFVGQSGRTRLLDLGVAAVAARRALVRRHLAGASYFAPEQLEGVTTARTDVFALGLLVWEMLAIRRPRYAPTFRALSEKIRFGTIAHLSRVVRPGAPAVGEAIGDVVARAVDPSPDRRFSHPVAFAQALASVVEPVTHPEAALMLGLARASGIRRISRPPTETEAGPTSTTIAYRDPLDTIPYEVEEA